MHSSEYKKAEEHLGKKVVLIGSCTSGMKSFAKCLPWGLNFLSVPSAHDIGVDLCDHGIGLCNPSNCSCGIST
jgi:hypothetical protein